METERTDAFETSAQEICHCRMLYKVPVQYTSKATQATIAALELVTRHLMHFHSTSPTDCPRQFSNGFIRKNQFIVVFATIN